jgi:hypothetical protein
MILNETPGVYASMQGGGSGDSRVNVRGFNQRNVAVMINGVPVNDMENGWVYWSNWDGLADVTQNIQVQRGLGTSNLSIPSIGGTINIITSAANAKPGFKVKQEFGNDRFLKSTLTYNTGILDNGVAFSASIVKKTADGYIDGTWTDAWSYFFTLNKSFGNHNFDITWLGAPQQHGQRDGSNDQTFDTWKNSYGGNLRTNSAYNGSYDASGAGWGYVSAANYNIARINQNRPESLDGLASALFGSIQTANEIDGKYVINNRVNYYHKPVYSLNWYWDIADKTNLSTVLYYSNGFGGGTGALNSTGSLNGGNVKYINPKLRSDYTYDWDDMIWYNSYGDGLWEDTEVDPAQTRWNEGKPYDLRYSDVEKRSKYILRSSVNQHNWYGVISTFSREFADNYKVSFGIDARSYKGIHYREVTSLLGGDYYVDKADKNDKTPADRMKRVGDKLGYYNLGFNRWVNGYGQLEYAGDPVSAFVSGSVSSTRYQRRDYFNYEFGDPKMDSDPASFTGGALKTGVNYNFDDKNNVFVNLGYLSTAPIFDNVYLNYVNDINPDANNEKVLAFEGGYGYTGSRFGVRANAYYTSWQDKAIVRTRDALVYNIPGLDALHTGVELDFSAILLENLRLNGALSFGNWKWKNDVVASVVPDNEPTADPYSIAVYADGIHVGDAPQTQFVLSPEWQPVDGLFISPVMKYFARHFADFDPASRTDSNNREDSYQIDGFALFDLHASYKFSRVPMKLNLHVLNLFDKDYVTEATDGSSHTASDVQVFYGFGRTFNTSLQVDF